MKAGSSKNIILYVILIIMVLGVIYTACKDITPEQERVESEIELKLGK